MPTGEAEKTDPVTSVIRDSLQRHHFLQRHLGPTLGYLVYAGHQRYPIVSIEFKGGMVHVEAKLYGPTTWRCDGHVKVYGADNILILESDIQAQDPVSVAKGDVLTIIQTLSLHT